MERCDFSFCARGSLCSVLLVTLFLLQNYILHDDVKTLHTSSDVLKLNNSAIFKCKNIHKNCMTTITVSRLISKCHAYEQMLGTCRNLSKTNKHTHKKKNIDKNMKTDRRI